MVQSLKRPKGPGPLRVTHLGDNQYRVESNIHASDGPFEDRYVEFGGFFGSHGPYPFSVAAELFALLKSARPYVEDRLHGHDGEVLHSVALLLKQIDETITKAEGRSDAL